MLFHRATDIYHISPATINLPIKRATSDNVDSFVMLCTTWIHVVESSGRPWILTHLFIIQPSFFRAMV